MPIAVPDSSVVIASTMSSHWKAAWPRKCEYVSASEQTWSIIAGL